jgi:hypothetical protein
MDTNKIILIINQIKVIHFLIEESRNCVGLHLPTFGRKLFEENILDIVFICILLCQYKLQEQRSIYTAIYKLIT